MTRETTARAVHPAPILAVALAIALGAGVLTGCGQPGSTVPASSALDDASPGAGPSVAASPSSATGPASTRSPSSIPGLSPAGSHSPGPGASIAPSEPGSGAASLPVLLGTIGDSITKAANVGPGALGDSPEHSWAVGTTPRDGVDSLLERLRGLGADPLVADEAISGATMRLAPAMARRILAAAAEAGAAGPVVVTILMGANDACARTAARMTTVASYERDLAETLAILRDGVAAGAGEAMPGLPAGSTIIVLSVPDVARLRDLPAPSGLAEAARGLFCPNLLAPDASPEQVETAQTRIEAFNAALAGACAVLEARDRPSGQLHCHHDGGTLFATAFGADDVSRLDGFHPSLAGQARIAELAWLTGPWAGASPAPGGSRSPGPDEP